MSGVVRVANPLVSRVEDTFRVIVPGAGGNSVPFITVPRLSVMVVVK